MKIFIYILVAIAAGMLVFNITQLDYNDLLSKQGTVALISALASACVIVLLTILLISKKISTKLK